MKPYARSIVLLCFTACVPRFSVPDDTRVACASTSDCPNQWRCDEARRLCLSPTEADPRCGDGVVDEGEACDCGEPGARLPTSCVGPNSDSAPNRCRSSCVLPRCGDGALDDNEECDDGNLATSDGCGASCAREQCGNTTVDPGEVCDDGNLVSGDGCSADCRSDERCGNATVDFAAGELCDCGVAGTTPPAGCDGQNNGPRSVCTSDCQTKLCGDGVVNEGEVCDNGFRNNGVVVPALPTPFCSLDCLSLGECGNAYRDTDAAHQEQCDDGNRRSHDGCSSACLQEVASWRQVFSAGEPNARSGSAAVYDARRERVVLFGGETTLNAELTFEYDGVRWRVAPVDGPSARSSHRMVFDSARGRVLLFGGISAAGARQNDTWVYDGVRWTRLVTAHAPSPRARFTLAYDAVRDRVVLFGGRTDLGINDETWEFDGTDWELFPPGDAPNPSAREWATGAYYASRGTVVMFGGETAQGPIVFSDETWEFDGSDWTLNPASGPQQRSRHVLEYVGPPLDRAVLYGGFSNSYRGDTWSFTGSAWVAGPSGSAAPSGPLGPSGGNGVAEPAAAVDSDRSRLIVFSGAKDTVNPSSYTFEMSAALSWSTKAFGRGKPEPIYRSAMAYDSRRKRAVMFGGDLLSGLSSETWEFDGSNWELSAATGPAARRLHSLVYMPERRAVVTFSGGGVAGLLDDTCSYDGAAWACSVPTGPSGEPGPTGRSNYTFAYDETAQQALLFGGRNQAGVLGDTWGFDGTHWRQLTGAPSPSAREFAVATYHRERGGVVLHGGVDAAGVTSDEVWLWAGGRWTLLGASASGARQGAFFAYLPSISGAVLHGGRLGFSVAGLNDTWTLGATGEVSSVALLGFPPPPRIQGAGFVEPERSSLFVFGGFGDSDADGVTTRVDDMWRFQYASATPDETCTDGADNDGDGLVDCADPDCAQVNLCLGDGCRSGLASELFAPGIYGCGGQVSFAEREQLCANHARPCSVFEWTALNGAATPAANYWLNEPLRYRGTLGACSAGLEAGTVSCPSTSFDDAARICGAMLDAFGNECAWLGCGLGSNAPNEHLGGCVDGATAGTLCCTR